MKRWIGGLLLLPLALACGGGGGRGGPTQPSNQLLITVVLSPGTTSFEAALSFDNRELLRFTCPGSCQQARVVNNVRSRDHAIAVTIIRQAGATVEYFIGDAAVLRQSNGSEQSVTLPTRRANLRPGQSVTWTIIL